MYETRDTALKSELRFAQIATQFLVKAGLYRKAHDRQITLPIVDNMSHFDAIISIFLAEVPMDDTGGEEVGRYLPKNLS